MPGLIGAIFFCPEMLNLKAFANRMLEFANRLARNISCHVLLNDALNWNLSSQYNELL